MSIPKKTIVITDAMAGDANKLLIFKFKCIIALELLPIFLAATEKGWTGLNPRSGGFTALAWLMLPLFAIYITLTLEYIFNFIKYYRLVSIYNRIWFCLFWIQLVLYFMFLTQPI